MKDKKYISDDPLLIKEWDFNKNTISPYKTTIGSAKKCYWICSICGHSWLTSANSRSSDGCGCPECAKKARGLSRRKSCAKKNSFLSAFPEVAKEWNYCKNTNLDIKTIAAYSNIKVWWRCLNCGNEWQTTVNHRTKSKTGCPKCSKKNSAKNKIQTHAKRNSLLANYPEIVAEWHPTKNGGKTPGDFSLHSNQKVWWLCSFCGNEWETTISHRSDGRGCPACSKAQTSVAEQTVYYYVLKAFPDAVNRYNAGFELDVFIPSIKTAIEYDGYVYHKSSKALIKDNQKDRYCKQSGIRLIRFRDPKLDDTESAIRITCEEHRITEGIKAFFGIIGNVCPDIDVDRDRICILERFRQNQYDKSLAKCYPEIAKEWHPTKNGKINPSAIAAMSNTKFWWKCRICGYEWPDTPNHRCGRESGCPLCAGKVIVEGKNDLATLYPDVAAEWDYEANYPLLPTQIASKSNKRVNWKCSAHGHKWPAVVSERTREGHSTACPYCGNKKVLAGFNDLATTNPRLAAEWSDKNDLKPTEVTAGSNKKVLWLCGRCGHEWYAVVYSRRNNNCPRCSGKKK